MKTSFVALCVAAIAGTAAASNYGIMTNFKALDVEECGKFHYAFSYAVRLSERSVITTLSPPPTVRHNEKTRKERSTHPSPEKTIRNTQLTRPDHE